MDAEGARELTRRIGANAELAPRPVPAGLSEGASSLYRWFGGGTPASASDPAPPPTSPSLRRARLRGR